MLKVLSFGQTDTGLRRSNNEDSFLCHPDLAVWAVADGMGEPHPARWPARFLWIRLWKFSRAPKNNGKGKFLVVQEISESPTREFSSPPRIVGNIRGWVHGGIAGFFRPGLLVGHVGDSRTYLFRDGDLKQLTRDHSLSRINWIGV